MVDSTSRFRFTKAKLAALEPGEGLLQVYDTESRGLILLITPAGVKTFYRQGRIDGKSRRVKIGFFPEVPTSKAREKCDAINGNIAEGKPVKASTRGGLTFGDLWQAYWDEHATVQKAESSRKHDLWQWGKLLQPAWENNQGREHQKGRCAAFAGPHRQGKWQGYSEPGTVPCEEGFQPRH